MDSFLSEEVSKGLRRAETKALRKKNRMRVEAGEVSASISRAWDGGFAIDLENAPKLRGRVDIYDGSRHLYQCLVVCSAREGSEMIYEFKRQTSAEDRRILDYDQDDDAPVALLR